MNTGEPRPDMDCRENIELFVDLFYQRLLQDAQLAPIFVDVAAIDLSVHLPHIKDYWCKLLLGEKGYSRHTMNIHRQLHGKRSLRSEDFQRWLAFFLATVDEDFSGERSQRAKQVATAIAANMEKSLGQPCSRPAAEYAVGQGTSMSLTTKRGGPNSCRG